MLPRGSPLLLMAFLAALDHSAFSTWLRGSDSIWAFPTVLTLHTLGMMVLAGASAVLDLRLLGVARQIPAPRAARSVSADVGRLLGEPCQRFHAVRVGRDDEGNPADVLRQAAVRGDRRCDAGADPTGGLRKEREMLHASSAARFLAVASIASWTLAITAGRSWPTWRKALNHWQSSRRIWHLHLLLNSRADCGSAPFSGVGMFLLAIVRKNDDLTKVSLEVLFVIAIGSIPAYMSGVAARDVIKDEPGVTEAAIATHQSAALLALACLYGTDGRRRLVRAVAVPAPGRPAAKDALRRVRAGDARAGGHGVGG